MKPWVCSFPLLLIQRATVRWKGNWEHVFAKCFSARECDSVFKSVWIWFSYPVSHLSWGRGTVTAGWVASPLRVVPSWLLQSPCVLLPHKIQTQIVGKQSGNGQGNKSCMIKGRSIGWNLVLTNCQLPPNGRLRSHFPLKRTCFYTWVTRYKQSAFSFSWWLCECASQIPKKGEEKNQKSISQDWTLQIHLGKVLCTPI